MKRAVLVAASALLGVAGCTVFTSFDGLDTGAAGGAGDAQADVAASASTHAAPVKTLAKG